MQKEKHFEAKRLTTHLSLQVRMTGGAGLLDMNGLPGGHSSSSEDSKKEEEEADFTFSADDIEK